VLAYDPRNDKWSNIGTSLLSRATVPVVEWRGFAVIPNGEMRPGVRSPEVWMFK
jgi:N-acetylneuraminic acid mutarotase